LTSKEKCDIIIMLSTRSSWEFLIEINKIKYFLIKKEID